MRVLIGSSNLLNSTMRLSYLSFKPGSFFFIFNTEAKESGTFRINNLTLFADIPTNNVLTAMWVITAHIAMLRVVKLLFTTLLLPRSN